MASRKLSKSVSSVIKAQYAFSRPSLLLRSRALSASAHYTSPNSSLFRPNSFIGNGKSLVTPIAALGHLFPHSFQFPSHHRFSTSTVQPNQNEFTEMAWEGLLNAFDAARVSNQQIVESKHLMKALLEQKDGMARRIFAKAGIDNSSVLQATDHFISKQPKVTGDTSG